MGCCPFSRGKKKMKSTLFHDGWTCKHLNDSGEGTPVRIPDDAMLREQRTADALGAIFEIVKDANVSLNQQSGKAAVEGVLKTLLELTGVLGLLMKEAEEGLPAEIQQMADERAQARKEKNWKRSDELRDALAAAGYLVKDTPQGQNITKA